MHAMEISQSGMDVEWRRLEVIAQNLANLSTVRDASGGPYRPMRLLSGPMGGFAHHLEQGGANAAGGVTVYGVEPMNVTPRTVYEPSNPQADTKGYVTYSGLDQAEEMTLLMKTSRIYEANIATMTLERQMYEKALEIGR